MVELHLVQDGSEAIREDYVRSFEAGKVVTQSLHVGFPIEANRTGVDRLSLRGQLSANFRVDAVCADQHVAGYGGNVLLETHFDAALVRHGIVLECSIEMDMIFDPAHQDFAQGPPVDAHIFGDIIRMPALRNTP